MPWLKSIFLFCECKEAVLLYNFGYGSYASCMEELKRYEDLTLHFPLVDADHLVPYGCLELMSDPSAHYSCRSEYIQFNLFVEQMAVGKEKTVNEKIIKSVQLKRTSPSVKHLTLCSSKRQKFN